MSDVTEVLQKINQGDREAENALVSIVYDELRDLANARLAKERPGQTLQSSALVNETYLRLFGNNSQPKWENRRHFFGAAAQAMKRILIDNARRKQRQCHGGDHKRIDIDVADLADVEQTNTVLPIDAALKELALEDPQAAEIMNLRYFAGLTIAQTAEAVGLPVRTTNRRWAYARAWLMTRLEQLKDE